MTSCHSVSLPLNCLALGPNGTVTALRALPRSAPDERRDEDAQRHGVRVVPEERDQDRAEDDEPKRRKVPRSGALQSAATALSHVDTTHRCSLHIEL